MATTARQALREPKATRAGELLNAVDLREFARLSRATAHLAIALSLPWQSRVLIDALIIASDGDGDTQIEIADYSLAFWMRSEQAIGTVGKLDFRTKAQPKTATRGTKISNRSLTGWVARVRRSLIKRQTEVGITLVEISPGGMKKGERFPSRYRLPILFFLRDVQEMLRTDSTFDDEPERAIQAAVLAVLKQEQRLLESKPVVERFRRPRFTGDVYLKMAKTYFLKALLEQEKVNQDGFPVCRDMWNFVDKQYEISKKAGKST